MTVISSSPMGSQISSLEIFLTITSLTFFILSTVLFYLYFKTKMSLSRAELASTQNEQLKETFRNLANDVLTGNSEKFLQLAKNTLEKETALTHSELSKKQVEFQKTVEPIQVLLEKYEQHIQIIEKDRARTFTQIETEMKRVADLSNVLTVETAALKNALKKPHVRGRWGEVQLKNCIELAGMSEFSDVTFQDTQETADQQRLIPDMTVRMPGGRIVIVDCKTPIDAFLSSLEATDDETRAIELARHGKHVKEHIRKLSAKAYNDNLNESADFTVMFLPNESFLYAALESEPDLVEFAIQKKILVATPPTFIGLLKVIRYGWNEERLAENAQHISETGKELHKRVCEFVDGFVQIGKHIDKAKMEYEMGLSRLESRVVSQAKKLEALGAKSAKSLPESFSTIDN
jgi:DNA recombination protein RmuC